MRIPLKMHESWNELKQRGDYKKISDRCNGAYSHQSVKMCIFTGQGDDRLIAIIESFFASVRQERIDAKKKLKKLIEPYL